jgi:hypothetical protein
VQELRRELFTRASLPDWTKPQTGRLNKSSHTVQAPANRSSGVRANGLAFDNDDARAGSPVEDLINLIFRYYDLHGRCDRRPDVRALFTKRRVNGTQMAASRRQNQYSPYDFPFVSSPGAELFTSPMPPAEFTSSAGAEIWFHSQSGQTGSFGTSRK